MLCHNHNTTKEEIVSIINKIIGMEGIPTEEEFEGYEENKTRIFYINYYSPSGICLCTIKSFKFKDRQWESTFSDKNNFSNSQNFHKAYNSYLNTH